VAQDRLIAIDGLVRIRQELAPTSRRPVHRREMGRLGPTPRKGSEDVRRPRRPAGPGRCHDRIETAGPLGRLYAGHLCSNRNSEVTPCVREADAPWLDARGRGFTSEVQDGVRAHPLWPANYPD
jgi:hypothetical protein